MWFDALVAACTLTLLTTETWRSFDVSRMSKCAQYIKAKRFYWRVKFCSLNDNVNCFWKWEASMKWFEWNKKEKPLNWNRPPTIFSISKLFPLGIRTRVIDSRYNLWSFFHLYKKWNASGRKIMSIEHSSSHRKNALRHKILQVVKAQNLQWYLPIWLEVLRLLFSNWAGDKIQHVN